MWRRRGRGRCGQASHPLPYQAPGLQDVGSSSELRPSTPTHFPATLLVAYLGSGQCGVLPIIPVGFPAAACFALTLGTDCTVDSFLESVAITFADLNAFCLTRLISPTPPTAPPISFMGCLLRTFSPLPHRGSALRALSPGL
jgi:hypothetical protein